MSDISYLLIGLFLPLFPLSLIFNALFMQLRQPILRLVLLLVWPQIGLWLLTQLDVNLPTWLMYWVLATSVLYAFRLVAQREVNLWIGFLATSIWSLIWLFVINNDSAEAYTYTSLALYTFMLTVPLLVLTLLAGHLARHFGAAYTNLYAGLAKSMPRFSGILVFGVLAATAIPIFPGFFLMLKMILVYSSASSWLIVLALLLVWLLWSWSSTRLIQGLLVGTTEARYATQCVDFSRTLTWVYALIFSALLISGLTITGGLL